MYNEDDSNMNIRNATVKEINSIVALQKEFTLYSRGHDVFLVPAENYAAEQAAETKKAFEKKNMLIHVAETNDTIIGYLIGAIKQRPQWRINRIGHVLEVFVSRSHRGKGIGKALMEKFFDEIKKQGVEYVDLSVYVNNHEALDFYKKLGFEEYKKYVRKKL